MFKENNLSIYCSRPETKNTDLAIIFKETNIAILFKKTNLALLFKKAYLAILFKEINPAIVFNETKIKQETFRKYSKNNFWMIEYGTFENITILK